MLLNGFIPNMAFKIYFCSSIYRNDSLFSSVIMISFSLRHIERLFIELIYINTRVVDASSISQIKIIADNRL